MYYVISCNGYRLIGSSNDAKEAERICMEYVDGSYANFINDSEGYTVGDCVDGFYGRRPRERYVDAATLTGMYDRY